MNITSRHRHRLAVGQAILPVLLGCLGLGAGLSVAADAPSAIVAATGIERGVAVHLGSSDGALECELASLHPMLVHGLALDEADLTRSRRRIQHEGIYGLATVEPADSLRRLPYAGNLVNLLIADLDALGDQAPAREEILRVLTPGGVAYLKQAGKWQTQTKSWPKGMDDWTHWCYGPEGNAVSHDTLVRPSTSLKWISAVQGQDLRIEKGMLFSPLRKKQPRGLPDGVDLVARDAFSGVPAWRCPTGLISGDRPHEFVAAGGLVFHFPSRQPCFAVATDARTGKLVREFSEGLRRPFEGRAWRRGGRPGMAILLVAGKTLIQGYGREVIALDITTGRRDWRIELPSELGAMAATPDGRRVFVHEVEDWDRGWARWGKHQTVAITCLLDGRMAWRNTELAGEEISDLIHHAGALYAFDPTTNLGDDGDADVFRFDAASGRLVWSKKGPKHTYNVFLNNAVVRGPDIISWGSFNNLRSYATADGAERNHTINSYNQRCTRMSATRNWLVFGLTTWVDSDFHWTQMSVGRSDCAYPAFLAHGQTFFTYNLACSCINPLRGIVALVPENPRPHWPDSRRLQQPSGKADSILAPRMTASKNVIAAEWQPDPLLFYFLHKQTPPVSSHGLDLVADVDGQTLSATRDGKVVWSFVTGGRIYGPPLVVDRQCYVASADGWLYCLDLPRGERHWRFLAAPCERKIVSYGQLESTWPIYNVVYHDGAVCLAAGRHAELDGGIFLWGLSPESGEIRWKTNLHTPAAHYPAGAKSTRNDRTLKREVASVTPLNGGLAIDGHDLVLVSPILKKSGSSNSRWGYFENPPGEQRGPLQARHLKIRPLLWNGKTINPQELVVLETKRS